MKKSINYLTFVFLFLFHSYSFAEKGFYWAVVNTVGSSLEEVVDKYCYNAGDYCSSVIIKPYIYDPSLDHIRTVDFITESGNVWNTERAMRYDCSYIKGSSASLPVCDPDYVEPVANCDDGFPPDIYGYEDFCDRPTPKKCPDGSYIEESSFCTVDNGICSDYSSCYNHARSVSTFDTNCSSATIFEFNYRDPNNWDYSCTVISPDSPDSPTNGGNGDGNVNNDPSSVVGSYTTVSGSDLLSLATSIDNVLRDDFGNIERAVRDNKAYVSASITSLNDTVRQSDLDTRHHIDRVKEKIEHLITSNVYHSNRIADNVNSSGIDIVDAINNIQLIPQNNSDIINSIDSAKTAIVDSISDLSVTDEPCTDSNCIPPDFGDYSYQGDVKKFDPDLKADVLIADAKASYETRLNQIKSEIYLNFKSVSSSGSCTPYSIPGLVELDVCSKIDEWSHVVRPSVLLCCSLFAFGILFRVSN